jgi:hypothetical protein
VQTVVVPAIASALNETVQANPSSSQAAQILLVFDIGNGMGGPCTNPDNSLAYPNDGVIGLCEVSQNQVLKGTLGPDVQLYQNGAYMPNPANTNKDAVSIGVIFNAVPAEF